MGEYKISNKYSEMNEDYENECKKKSLKVVSTETRLFDNRTLGLLTIEEVAQCLGKAPQTIRNMIARREIPYVRIGNRNMIREESLQAWLKRKEIKPWA